MYKSRRRPWVKLYCRDWLASTVRFTLSELDRSRFIDLLAMAGDSRFPGLVASGYEGDSNSTLLGYPIDWLAAQMRCPAPELRQSLDKLEAQERIKVREVAGTFLIEICSWNTYQSEYLRQIQKVTGSAPTSGSSTQILEQTSGSTDALEVDVEGDVEEEKPTPSAKDALVTEQFALFWKRYPNQKDRKRAFRAWKNLSLADRDLALKNLEAWINCAQWRRERGRYIPYAQGWLNRELFKESPAVAAPTGRSFDERSRAAEKKTR